MHPHTPLPLPLSLVTTALATAAVFTPATPCTSAAGIKCCAYCDPNNSPYYLCTSDKSDILAYNTTTAQYSGKSVPDISDFQHVSGKYVPSR